MQPNQSFKRTAPAPRSVVSLAINSESLVVVCGQIDYHGGSRGVAERAARLRAAQALKTDAPSGHGLAPQ
jgi:hypothetical protein